MKSKAARNRSVRAALKRPEQHVRPEEAAPVTQENSRAMHLQRQPGESKAEVMAHTSLRPTVQAAITLMEYNKSFGEMSITALVADLGKQCELVSNGEFRRAEAVLVAQAHTLDAIFNLLARRASGVEYLSQLDTNLRLALKAQSQCRATLETLAAIKNPPAVAFVRQANIAQGPQQVNNGPARTDGSSRAGETEIPQSKLLEVKDGERLDFGTPSSASEADSALETVGAVHRPKNARR